MKIARSHFRPCVFTKVDCHFTVTMGKKKSVGGALGTVISAGTTAYQPLVEEDSGAFSFREPSAPSLTSAFGDLDGEYDSFSEDDDPGEPMPRSLVVPSMLPISSSSAAVASVPPGTALALPPQHAVVSARVVRAPGKKQRERVKASLVSSAPPAVVTQARVVATGLPLPAQQAIAPYSASAASGGPRVIAARVVTPGQAVASSSSPSSSSASAASPVVISARVITPGSPAAYVTPGGPAMTYPDTMPTMVGQPLPQVSNGPVVISARVISKKA
jgi:hypothetical protein